MYLELWKAGDLRSSALHHRPANPMVAMVIEKMAIEAYKIFTIMATKLIVHLREIFFTLVSLAIAIELNPIS